MDTDRTEAITPSASDHREVIAVVWYPAETGSGSKEAYFPGLARLAPYLRASGELSPLEVLGLRFIQSNSYRDAPLSRKQSAYPLVVLSPGNATNVEFYAALAEDLASHGYVVAGLNNPYDVAAVALMDGSIAQDASDLWPLDLPSRQAVVQERIEVRVQDVTFLLDRLQELYASRGSIFSARLDLSRAGIIGHSLGGITAAQACLADPRLKACLNLDGIQAGGAFSARPDPALPTQPFMMITKEEQLPQAFIVPFESLTANSYLVQVHGASHDSFTDGPLLTPALLPLPGKADRITAILRSYVLAFFDQELKGQASPLLAQPVHNSRVTLQVFPAGG